jgi:hypothetical protein
MLDSVLREWKKDVLETAGDRFERRLTEVEGSLRLEITRMHASLVKWMFVFWIGQFGVTLSVIAILMRHS